MKAISRWQMRYLPFLVLLSCSALAVEPAPAVPQPTTLEAAAAQRQEADRMRKSAEDLFAAEQAACYKKFLVNDCLEDAKKRRTQSMIDARNASPWAFCSSSRCGMPAARCRAREEAGGQGSAGGQGATESRRGAGQAQGEAGEAQEKDRGERRQARARRSQGGGEGRRALAAVTSTGNGCRRPFPGSARLCRRSRHAASRDPSLRRRSARSSARCPPACARSR